MTVALLTIGYLAAFAVIADMRMHRRVQDQLGVNLHGYRGPVARQDRIEDRRVLMLGGTLAFGSGLVLPETVPAYLERNLNQKWRQGYAGLSATVIDLAGPGDGPASYRATLADYASLGGDVVCLLGDTHTLDGGSTEPWRHGSRVFKLTGYFPLLPVLSGRDPSAAPDETRPVLTTTPAIALPGTGDCGGAFKSYCDAMAASVDYVFGTGRRVLVARLPPESAPARARDDAVAALLAARLGARPDFRFVDISRDAELTAMAGAGALPVTAQASDRVADLLTTPLLELMR